MEAAMNTSNPEAPVNADAVGSNRWYLSAAPVVRALLHLCVPMAAAMIVGAVYNLINAGFIGSLHDTALLAAITFGTPILGLVMAVGGVFGVGGGAQISRLLGAAEHDPARAGEIKRVSSLPSGVRPSPAPCSEAPGWCCCTRWCRCSARTPPPCTRRGLSSP